MRKILKLESWNPSESFTSQNVLDESHWFVKGIKRALTLLDIGNFSLSYASATNIILQTANYGTFSLARPSSGQSGPYLFYVNSEDKELWGGSCLSNTYDNSSSQSNASLPCNHIRGPIRYSTSGSNTSPIYISGGVLQLKFENGTIKGFSNGDRSYYCIASHLTPSHIGLVLAENYKAESTPLTSVPIKYTKQAIVNRAGSSNDIHFYGEYFRSIYVCDKYYLGALKSSDNTKFIFDGYLFLVDDARDIETV